MKEVLRELDEAKVTRDDVISQSKDSEKKIQTLEAEVLHLTEVCMSMSVQKNPSNRNIKISCIYF